MTKMKRLIFLNRYLKLIQEPNTLLIVIDEAGTQLFNVCFFIHFLGFGTKSFRHYGYSQKNKPCILKNNRTSHNVTLIAAISRFKVE
jgi:hypothetical protein